MADEIYGLSAEDLTILKAFLKRLKHNPQNARTKTVPENVSPNTDIYIARIPQGGIAGTASSRSVGTGSGSGSVDVGGLIGVDCKIYYINFAKASLQNLGDTGFTATVYNVGQSYVYGPQLKLVFQDRFGNFIVSERETEIIQVTNSTPTFSSGWPFYQGTTLDFAGGVFTSGDAVEVGPLSATSQFLNGNIILDCHLVGYNAATGRRQYLADGGSGSQGKGNFLRILHSPGTGTGTHGGGGVWYPAREISLNATPSTIASTDLNTDVVHVQSPNGYPLKVGAKGWAHLLYQNFNGSYRYYSGTAELWDYGNCS